MVETEPQVLRLAKRDLDVKSFRYKAPDEDDYDTLIRHSALVYDADTDELVIAYLMLDDEHQHVWDALDTIEFYEGQRTAGLPSTSRIFGYQPRVQGRRDFCTAASLARDNPQAHDVIAAYANQVGRYYREYNPILYAKHDAQTKKVLDMWRMEGSLFTSGIINRNNPLRYHFDAGNFSGVWSNMLVFKRDIAGGYLAVPQYGVAFELPNNSLFMFDGQGLMHGVTPIHLLSEQARRYSIVFYSLKQMWRCLPIQDEIARVRRVRTEREFRRLEKSRG